jgi:type I restriction enzyme M protein
MTSAAIVQKLWNYGNVLRDDGRSYGDYVEQLTALTLALSQGERGKMGNGRRAQVAVQPAECRARAAFSIPWRKGMNR